MNTLTGNTTIQKCIFICTALFCLTPLVSSPLALALGLAVALFSGNPYQQHLPRYIHLLLKVCIVGLGFGLKLDEALQAGKTGFLLTVSSIVGVLLLGSVLGRLLRLEKPLSYLISVGTAICGGSAIAAVSPIVKPDSRHISVALAIIFTLNSVALFVFPFIGQHLHLTQQQFGLWCAVGIHDTSSVVGAAGKYGNEALKIATTVKLARALWIIPLSLLTAFIFKSKESRIKLPVFIGFFALAILFNSYVPVPACITEVITLLAKTGLNLTLYFIGTTISFQALRKIGFGPLIFSLSLWIVISVASLAYILNQP